MTLRAWRLAGVLCLGLLPGCGDDDGGGPDAGGDDAATPDGGAVDDGAVSDGDVDGGQLPSTVDRFLPAWTSGTRLKARVIGPEDGDAVFLSWWDSELEVPCEFAYAADGILRCLPALPGNAPTGHLSDTCDDAPVVVNFRPDCAEATHVRRTVDLAPTCAHERRLLVGESVWTLTPLESPPEAYYDGVPGACDGPREPPEEGQVSEIAEEVVPTRFVAGDYRVIPDGNDLGVRILEAEDGARQIVAIHDPDDGQCGQSQYAVNIFACGPSIALPTESRTFGDEECLEPVVGVPDPDPEACAPLTTVVGVWDIGEEGPQLSYGRIGEEITDTVYAPRDDTCEAIPVADVLSERFDHIHRVEPYVPRPLATAAYGTGDLKPLYLTREDGVLLIAGARTRSGTGQRVASFEDAEGTACAPASSPSGMRCVPADALRAYGTIEYADDGCSERILPLANAQLPDPVPSHIYVPLFDDCAGPFPGVEDVFELGALHEGAVYRGTPEDCVEALDPGDGPRFVAGDSVLTDLPALMERTAE